MKYYDKLNNRLVFIEEKANSTFWDNTWKKQDMIKMYPEKISSRDFIVKYTKKFLPFKSKILEGGCGLGQNVYKLHNLGYKCIGLDYAPKTIKLIKNTHPELNIKLGDVRNLKFKNNYFEGYWSLGVIEHFYKGYTPIIREMSRVIKKGGYVFVTFPHMSLIRRLKAKFSVYPYWEEKEDKSRIKRFYQFALDENEVIKNLEAYNFELIEKHYLDGLGGITREIPLLKPIIEKN